MYPSGIGPVKIVRIGYCPCPVALCRLQFVGIFHSWNSARAWTFALAVELLAGMRHHLHLRLLGPAGACNAGAYLPVGSQGIAWSGRLPRWCGYSGPRSCSITSLRPRCRSSFHRGTAWNSASGSTSARWSRLRAAARRNYELRGCATVGRTRWRLGRRPLGYAQHYCSHLSDRCFHRKLYERRILSAQNGNQARGAQAIGFENEIRFFRPHIVAVVDQIFHHSLADAGVERSSTSP